LLERDYGDFQRMFLIAITGHDGFSGGGGGVRRSPPRRHVNIFSITFHRIHVVEMSEFFQSSACQDDETGCHWTYLAKGSNSQVLGQYELSHLDRGLFPLHVVMTVFALSLSKFLCSFDPNACHISGTNSSSSMYGSGRHFSVACQTLERMTVRR
jgi:hypothetical protein